jgi:hypothetical protein
MDDDFQNAEAAVTHPHIKLMQGYYQQSAFKDDLQNTKHQIGSDVTF